MQSGASKPGKRAYRRADFSERRALSSNKGIDSAWQVVDQVVPDFGFQQHADKGAKVV